MLSHNLEKKLVKVRQKTGKMVSKPIINFSIYLNLIKILLNRHSGELNKTYSVNICFT